MLFRAKKTKEKKATSNKTKKNQPYFSELTYFAEQMEFDINKTNSK